MHTRMRDLGKSFAEAVAGSGKSVVAGAVTATVAEILRNDKSKKQVYAQPTRAQRDLALEELRRVLPNPLDVVALGRWPQNKPMEDDDQLLNPRTEALIRRHLSVHPQKPEEIEAQKQNSLSQG